MRPIAVRSVLFAIALASFPAVALAASPDFRDIAVAIHRDGEAYVVDVAFSVDATPQEAWSVLTDYDHMSEFVSNLTMSRIIHRASDSLEVAQTSRLKIGFIDLKFDTVRKVEFVPLQEIRSKLVRGGMKMSAFTTRLAAEGDMTRITNHGRFIPDRWIPPLIGIPMLEAETRKQFAELRAEVLRRKGSKSTNPE
jgi:carbon monoxide dehydrogenase subunit G